ncbi:hypothetical protein BDZ85DRAFT_268714 [Elsinoe ampelina]|uniref:Uncharacterized protein n=1 Tax=Elsinoe ampelina TaxID=302913 RepID=A0A6A6G1M2_9PEZI|nr:hypothetical protein BDZ85DRAFT_268714 [Elsinoe ampelina]
MLCREDYWTVSAALANTMAPKLEYVFTLNVDLAPPVDYGSTSTGDRRFIPITGGTFSGPKLSGRILPGGGDWNNVRSDGVVHVYAKYSIQADDGTIISITNEGYGRSSQDEMKGVFASDYNGAPDASSEWYTKTWPRFDVEAGKHEWLGKSCFLGELLRPDRPGHVKIEVYEIL